MYLGFCFPLLLSALPMTVTMSSRTMAVLDQVQLEGEGGGGGGGEGGGGGGRSEIPALVTPPM